MPNYYITLTMTDGRKITIMEQAIVSFANNPKGRGSVVHRTGDAFDVGVAVRETPKKIRKALDELSPVGGSGFPRIPD